MKLAINPATTMRYDFEADVAAYHRAGIRHMELWIEKADRFMRTHSISETRDILAEREINLVGACGTRELMLQNVATAPTLVEFERKLALCRDLACPTLVVIPDLPKALDPCTYSAVEKNLRSAARIAEDYGINLGLEFLRGNPLISTLSTAKQVVRGVGCPNLALVIDFFHFWMDKNRMEDFNDLKKEEILMIHIDDVPGSQIETINDYDRVFPFEGRNITDEIVPLIQAIGYDGFWSLEIFSEKIWSWPLEKIVQRSVLSLETFNQRFVNGRPQYSHCPSSALT